MRRKRNYRRAVQVIAAAASPLVESLECRALLTGAGELDPTFGVEGRITTDVVTSLYGFPSALVVQPDGGVLVAGSIGNEAALIRFAADGALDTAFGASGRARLPYRGRIESVALA